MSIKGILKTAAVLTGLMASTSSATTEELQPHEKIVTDNPLIQTCVKEASDAVIIDGATKSYSNTWNAVNQYYSEEFINNDPQNPIGQNGMGTSISVKGNSTSFFAFHEGTLSDKKDAVSVSITINFNENEVTGRDSAVRVDGPETSPFATKHGTQMVSATQTMEHVFGKCMGIENEYRHADAATYVAPFLGFLPPQPKQP